MSEQKTIIIGFGHKSRHGKDTCVKHLIEKFGGQYDMRRYAFGDDLKAELYDTLNDWRHPYWETNKDYLKLPHPPQPFYQGWTDKFEDKVAWVDANKKDPLLARHLQLYATEFRRAQDPFYWVKRTRARIEADRPQFALMSDVRMPNEFYFVASYGGYTVKVTRIGFVLNDGRDPNHYSEIALDNIKFHFEIAVPDGGEEQIAELKADAEFVFNTIVAAQTPQVPDFETETADASV